MGNQRRSLQDLLDEIPDPVQYFYNETRPQHFALRGESALYIPPEFTNWREEQQAWRETAVLMDQSHHMPELFLGGPDAFRLLQKVGVNSLENFTADRAKQFVSCTPQGYLVGDCIAYRHGESSFELVSGMTVLNWIEYQAEAGGYDVAIERDQPTLSNPSGRRVRYRFQLDGPNTGDIVADAVEGEAPVLPFFRTVTVRIAGCEVLLLRHGMAGHQGAELSGPFEDLETVKARLLTAGEKHGLRQGGTRAYFTTAFESGWIGYPCPGIYTDEELRGFREWLPASGWEGNLSLAGSYVASAMDEYYVTPWELGYGKIVKFDHDFIGREALERMKDQPHRERVTLVWDTDDVMKLLRSDFTEGLRYKTIDLPVANYGFPQHDEVRSDSGELIGISRLTGYSSNERAILALATVDPEYAQPGTRVVVTWGEPGGGSRKPRVPRHQQLQVRATVEPVPYATAVTKMKQATLKAGS